MEMDRDWIDLFLQGEITDKAVNVAGFLLTIAVHPTHRLSIMTWVPRGIKHNHTVGPNQIYPQAARSERNTANYK